MKRSRLEFLLIGVTVLALTAGVVAGLLAARLPGSVGGDRTTPIPPAPGPLERASLAEALQLTPEQSEQMREIWEGTRGKVHQTFDKAQDLQRKRDEALIALLDDEQKAKFEKISSDFADQFVRLSQERDASFRDAVTRTEGILNDEQRLKYREILPRVPPKDPGAAGMGPPPIVSATKPAKE